MLIRFTHPFSLIINMLLLAPVTLAVIFLAAYFDGFYPAEGAWFWVYLIVSFFIVRQVYWFLQNNFGAPLGTYLYCRFSLGAHVPWRECRIIYPFFSYNSEGKWYPMTHVKDLPKQERRNEVLNTAKKIHHANKKT